MKEMLLRHLCCVETIEYIDSISFLNDFYVKNSPCLQNIVYFTSIIYNYYKFHHCQKIPPTPPSPPEIIVKQPIQVLSVQSKIGIQSPNMEWVSH